MNAHAEQPIPENAERAIFAGGCFWCIEAELQEISGVYAAISGYIGGETDNPTYEQIGTGRTGHAEAVEIFYDPAMVTYEKLLDVFWGNIDPTDAGGQFFDRGSQYRTEIFYLNDAQKEAAETSKARYAEKLGQEIVTGITKATTFYPAEDYHQDYYKTNPMRYNAYKYGSRRDATLDRIWGENRPSTTEK